MEHPLIDSLEHLTIDELQEKITELNKKLTIGMRTGNMDLCNQIRMAIESYTVKLRQKQDEQFKGQAANFDDKIDIS